MSEHEPWRDPSCYTNNRRCHECGGPGGGPWGDWCHPCNVKRMERINKSLARIAADYQRRGHGP